MSNACAYCNDRRGHQTDHLITSNQARRNLNAARERENPRFKVRCCHQCNMAKGTLLLAPASHADIIEELEQITKNEYRVWDGDLAALRR